ncbi:MAG: polyprenyl synthetase family protein [Actinomycetota bacterium]|nr:polyprenyl synthetase family protein [Actinomycetota bacterium]
MTATARRGGEPALPARDPAEAESPQALLDLVDVPGLAADMAEVEVALKETVRSGDRFLDEVAMHLTSAGGKRFRPLLVVTAARAVAEPGTAFSQDRMVTAAVAVELLHLASLYHDDVIDEAERRRGIVTVNARWGNSVAVVAGDYLLARCAELVSTLGLEETTIAARTLGDMSKGETQELGSMFDVERDELSYLEAIEGKTASLISTTCRLSAMQASVSDDVVDAMATFGRFVGMAYQVMDDVLDLDSSADRLGKIPGQDLVEGVYTLPVIYALQRSERLRNLLGRPVDGEDLELAVRIIRAEGGLDEGRRRVREYVDGALDVLRDIDGGDPLHMGGLTRLVSCLAARADPHA